MMDHTSHGPSRAGGGMKPVTAGEIEAKKTVNGGWTKDTLVAWGVPWPPPKGWKKRLLAGEQP